MISPIRFLMLLAVLTSGMDVDGVGHPFQRGLRYGHLRTIEVRSRRSTGPTLTSPFMSRKTQGTAAWVEWVSSVKPRRADPFGLDKLLDPTGRPPLFGMRRFAMAPWAGSCCK